MVMICFIFLLCLECNLVIIEDTYILYCLFTGSLVAASCSLVQFCRVEVLHLQLDLFMLGHWFVACCLLLFASTLQGWGPASTVGDFFCTLQGSSPAPAIGPAVLSFIIDE
jgi:hypothetical protein